jgi:pantothenate kinase-related protein Tda10
MEFAASMAAAAAAGNAKIPCKLNSWDEFWTSLENYSKLESDDSSKLVYVEEERGKVYGWLHKQKDDLKDKTQNGEESEIKFVADFMRRFDAELT